MTREEKFILLNELLEYEEKNDIGLLTRAERREFQQWISEALEQEPCEDAISRQAVIDELKRYFYNEYYQRTSIQDCRDCFIEDVLKHLPPVTPQEPKTGHWIVETPGDGRTYETCDKCKVTHVLFGERDKGTNYCPNCVSFMRGDGNVNE